VGMYLEGQSVVTFDVLSERKIKPVSLALGVNQGNAQ